MCNVSDSQRSSTSYPPHNLIFQASSENILSQKLRPAVTMYLCRTVQPNSLTRILAHQATDIALNLDKP